MPSSGHAHRSFNKRTESGKWVTELHVTPIWWYTAANWKFLKTQCSSTKKFSVSISECRLKLIILKSVVRILGMSFWFPNAVFVPKMSFSSPKFAFWLRKSVRFWKFSFTYRTPLNSGILRSGSTTYVVSVSEIHLYIRKRFVFRDC